MRHVDLETWPRREHFKVFSAWDYPHLSLCANVDLTAFHPAIKQRGVSLNVALVYVIARTAKAIPEFRYRI
jgi:chloramphenicol O-acetyltransferase type A